MDVLAEIAELADRRRGAAGYDFSEIIDEFRKSTLDELDYRREAANLQKAGAQPVRVSNDRHPAADRRLLPPDAC